MSNQKGYSVLIVLILVLALIGLLNIIGPTFNFLTDYLNKTKLESRNKQSLTTAIQSGNIDKIKKELENVTKLWIELIDISPKDNNILAFAGIPDGTLDETPKSGYGIYMFNKQTGKITTLWSFKGQTTGRGAGYTDNAELKFSPDGNALFLNKTGISIPGLLILSDKGEVIYESGKDETAELFLGHPTWISNKELIFIKSDDESPVVFNIRDKKTTPTNLPTKIYNLTSNRSSTAIAAHKLSDKKIEGCDPSIGIMDLVIYAYPSGKLIKTINQAYMVRENVWKTDDIVAYKSVVSCNILDLNLSEPKEEKVIN